MRRATSTKLNAGTRSWFRRAEHKCAMVNVPPPRGIKFAQFASALAARTRAVSRLVAAIRDRAPDRGLNLAQELPQMELAKFEVNAA